MFRKKLISIITSAVMCFGMTSGAIAVSAEEDEKLYTLDELLAMSDEDFLKLDGAQKLYDVVKIYTELYEDTSDGNEVVYGGISARLVCTAGSGRVNDYKANITEDELEKLLGKTVEYTIESPIYAPYKTDGVYYDDSFTIYCKDYEIERIDNIKPGDIPDSAILNMAKFYYCVRQVIWVMNLPVDYYLNPPTSDKQIIEGDVNVDKIVDSIDVEYMEKGLSGELKLTELQMKIADVNGDGTFDKLDVEKLKADIAARPEEKIYTLDELLAMSDEDFLNLDGAQEYYDKVKYDAEHLVFESTDGSDIVYGGISGDLYVDTIDIDSEKKYKANITEDEIKRLLGETVEYTMYSPIYTSYRSDAIYYDYLLWVHCRGYAIEPSNNIKPDIPDSAILNMAKFYYCVSQVIEINYLPTGYALDSAPSIEQVLEGDVNVDKIVDSVDVEYMEKGLSGELKLTELQLEIADVNGDGTFDELDVEKLKADIAASSDPTVKVIAVPENIEASMYGDVNGDSEVNIADVVVLNLLSIDPDEYQLTDVEIANADCHKDGVIDSFDSAILMNYVAQLIDISELGK